MGCSAPRDFAYFPSLPSYLPILIIGGGGPTALTAAIYAARGGFDVLVIERSGLGGQAGITERH